MASSIDRDEEREQQLNAIVAEYYRLDEAGTPPENGTFIAQYPEFRDDLKDFFADLGVFRQSEIRLYSNQ